MIELLSAAKRHVRDILRDRDDGLWKSIHIDYHPPIVDRLWIDWIDDLRINLHRFQPCQPGQAFFHPHRNRSAIEIIEGGYTMGIGVGAGIEPPPVVMTFCLEAGSSYEMPDHDTWHYVAPFAESWSITITDKPIERPMPLEPKHILQPVDPNQKRLMLEKFRRFWDCD
jgi:hypothetical protein